MIVFAYITCGFVWGTTWFAIRRCTGASGYPTFAAAALRFALAALLLGGIWAVGWARPGPKDKRQVRGLVLAGVLGALSYGLVYLAEQSISGGLAAVIFATFPLATALLATASRIEKVARAQMIGSVVALLGMILVFADRLRVSGPQALGVVLMLASVFVSALYTTLLKRRAGDVHPLATTGVFLGTAAVALGVFAAVFERKAVPWPPPVGPTIALIYLAVVGSVFVFACYFYLLKKVRLMTVAMLVLLEPVIALAVDAIWEREVVLVARSYAGIGVIAAGVALSLLVGRAREG